MNEEINFEKLKIQGIKVNYFFICKRKLWLFDKNLSQEHTSDFVEMGKIIHQSSLKKTKRNLLIDDLINIDIAGVDKIEEVKLSKKMEYAHIMQLLYYLYFLENLGIKRKGFINYPKLKKKTKIEITDEKRKEIKNVLTEINKTLKLQKPPKKEKTKICRNCSYYEFCFA